MSYFLMARIARIVLPDVPHHVTQRGVRSMNVFYSPDDYRLYKELMREQCERFGVKIIAYCLMTNHVHLIAVPSTEESISRAIGEAHRLYTRAINFRLKVRGYLFQGRFFSTPLDEQHLFAALRYVEQNPVRAGILRDSWKYPYSSARFHIGEEPADPLLSEYSLLGQVEDWKAFLETAPSEIDMIREKTRTGRPCGDESFYQKIREDTGMDYAPKSAGRPKKK